MHRPATALMIEASTALVAFRSAKAAVVRNFRVAKGDDDSNGQPRSTMMFRAVVGRPTPDWAATGSEIRQNSSPRDKENSGEFHYEPLLGELRI